MEGRNGKPRPYHLSLPHAVTINGTASPFSPPTPQGEDVCPTLPPPSIHASSNQQMTHKTPSHSLYPGCKSGLRTPIQHWFSLELARCLTASPTLINLISLSFCLMSRNSFPTRAQTFLVARRGTLGSRPHLPTSPS